MKVYKHLFTTALLLVAFLSVVNAKDNGSEKTAVVASNDKFLNKIINENLKSINKELLATIDAKSFNWTSLRWSNNVDCEVIGEISFKDSCGSSKIKVEILVTSKVEKEHKNELVMKADVTASEQSLASCKLKSIALYLPRCEGGNYVLNDNNLVWLDAIKKGKVIKRNIP